MGVLIFCFSHLLITLVSPGHTFVQNRWPDSIGCDTVPNQSPGSNLYILDTVLFEQKLLALVQNKPSDKWPVRTVRPLAGALLPFERIVAYYGNFYSPAMGVLGEPPADKMLKRLEEEVRKWQQADTSTPVQAALQYIAVTAQRNEGIDGKYRLRMPFDQIDKTLDLAKKINAIVFLEIQVGHSTVQQEIPRLEKYLRLPTVHLGIDPEYSMKSGAVPCSEIGSFDAADINLASEYLAKIVRQYHLPPKILVVHRFTKAMVTNYANILTRPEVEIVINMDGFGFPARKIDSYNAWIADQPVQFTGFKLFYKKDTQGLMQPEDVLKLYPRPIYIQYQ